MQICVWKRSAIVSGSLHGQLLPPSASLLTADSADRLVCVGAADADLMGQAFISSRGPTGWKLMSFATPFIPMMDIAWSMPPDWVPTYRSQVHANSATSCINDGFAVSSDHQVPSTGPKADCRKGRQLD